MKIESWKEATIGDVCKIGHGRDYKNLKSGDVPVYGTGGYMTSVDNYLYNGETVCIGRKGTIDKPLYHNGKIWTVDTLFYTYDFQGILPKYLYYAFCTIDWLSMNEASGVPSLTAKNISTITLQLPPLPEQQRIAKALSDVDALISTTEKLIQKKKNIKQGTMQNLLTGKKRLPGFGSQTKPPTYKQTELGPIPEDWEVKNIGTTCNVITGGEAPVVYSKDKNTLYKYPIYSNGKEVYGYHASYTIDHDAVCISSIGENTGDIFYYQKNFTPIIRLKVIIPKKSNIDTEFLYYCLKTIKIDTTKNGGIPNINSNDVKSINYIQPTSKKEQTAIANVLSSMDKEIETLNAKLEKYRNLKTAMMQQLLTGKIRL